VATVFKKATAHKVDSYYTLAISYCTFCVVKHNVLGPVLLMFQCCCTRSSRLREQPSELSSHSRQ